MKSASVKSRNDQKQHKGMKMEVVDRLYLDPLEKKSVIWITQWMLCSSNLILEKMDPIKKLRFKQWK